MKSILRFFSFVLVIVFSISVLISTVIIADDTKQTDGILNAIEVTGIPTQTIDFKAKSMILIESISGNILQEKNSHEKLPPASVTKVMSMLLVMEAIKSGRITINDVVTISESAKNMGGSQVYLAPGEKFPVHELLKCVAVASANDATVALAEHVAGSEEAFVSMMNERAVQLGMNDTSFMNATGLDADNHYTSAYDIALMSRELMNKHPKTTEYTTIWMDTIRNGEFGLANTNKLVKHFTGTNGLKTGSTSKAGFCVSAAALRGNLQLIAVILGAPDSKTRFAEAAKLLSFGFANYSKVNIAKKGDLVSELEVLRGVNQSVKGVYPDNVDLLVGKGQSKNIATEVVPEEKLTAPISEGQKIGQVIFKIEGQIVAKSDMVAANKVDKSSFINLFIKMVRSWFRIGRED